MAPLASWLSVAVLGAELSGRPWPRRLAHAATTEPRIAEVTAAGTPGTLAVPGRRLPRPAFVFVNGVTARGRLHPLVRRLAGAAARAGFVCLVPDPPGLATGELTGATVEGVVGAAQWLCDRPEVLGGRIGLTGVSLGTTLSLLAAGRGEIASHVSVVAGVAPFASLPNTIRAATTGQFVDRGSPFDYPTSSFLALVVGRSLIANLESDDDRAHLRPLLLGVADDDPDPLAALRGVDPSTVSAETRSALSLLVNRDPDRFPDLYGALPDTLSAKIRRLSPIEGADRLAAVPIEIASAPRDTYFPLCESQALVELLPICRLTVSGALAHAIPSPNLEAARESRVFAAFLARTLTQITDGAARSTTPHD